MTALLAGWTEIGFDEVFDIKGGSQPPKSEFVSSPRDGYIRLLQIRDFESDEKAVYIPQAARWPTCTEDDIMIGRYGASVGKVLGGKAGAYNVALVCVLINEKRVDRTWARYFFRSDRFQAPIAKISRSAQNGFNKEDLSFIRILLPPLDQQRGIVAQLDSFFSGSNNARKELDHIPKLVERYKQAVLSAAFSGVVSNKEQIALEKLAPFITSGSRGWAKYYSEGGAIFIRVANVTRNQVALDLSEIQRVTPPGGSEGARTKLREGDIVISITADLGRVGVVPSDFGEAYVNQHIALVRLADPTQSLFTAWFLASSHGQSQLFEHNRGVTKAGLGLDDIRAVKIPATSDAERTAIISQIETAFSRINRILDDTSHASALIGRLNGASLAKAFCGELRAGNTDQRKDVAIAAE